MRGASVDFVDYNIEVARAGRTHPLSHLARLVHHYNPQVIRQLTIPNVIANLAAASGFAGGGVDGADGAVGCARFFGGDWNRLAAVAPPDGYDLILSADTLYNTQTASELAQLVQNYHKRPAGLRFAFCTVFANFLLNFTLKTTRASAYRWCS
jgi:hypothetical protein